MFFVVGSARSGTTLLRLMLNAHPEIAVPPESRFIVDLYRPGPVAASEFLDELRRHRRFEAWELPVEAVRGELEHVDTAPFAELVVAAYRAYAHARGKPRYGDKTPRYVLNIPLLAELFPGARFVHVVRDGRNVALSYADVPFGPKTVARAARHWADRVSAGIEGGRPLGDERYLELFYERLVADPATELKRLCSFLGVGFEPQMLDHASESRAEVLGRATRFNPHVTERPTEGVRAWEKEMPDSDVAVFEAVAGEVLDRLGYPRRHPRPGARTRAAASLGRVGLPLNRLRRGRS